MGLSWSWVGEGHSVRLYTDRSLTRAKTAFPGLGAPITAIDVSFDGTWVLATTDTYLLLINTVFRDSKTNDPTTGFQVTLLSPHRRRHENKS